MIKGIETLSPELNAHLPLTSKNLRNDKSAFL
jgi:hypothetical protein